MKKKRYYYRYARWLIKLIKKNPFKFLLLFALVCIGSGAAAYAYLDQYEWGRILNKLVFTMLSSEASVVAMYANKNSFWEIIGYVIAADACNIAIDLFFVNQLIAWKFTRTKIEWVSHHLNKLLAGIKSWLPFCKGGHSVSSIFKGIVDHFNDIKKNPSKAGLGMVFTFAVIPRLPFMIIGGVSCGVFIIRYNKFGWRGWIALCLGIISRSGFLLASFYGVSSIF